MKFGEIVQKVLGADQTKDYNFTMEEINQPSTPPETPPETKIDDKPAVDNNSTIELAALQEQLKKQTEEIDALKALNRQLVLQTPAEPEMTTEQRIMALCYPQGLRKETTNG